MELVLMFALAASSDTLVIDQVQDSFTSNNLNPY